MKSSKRDKKRKAGMDHYSCSGTTEHHPECDRTCVVLTQSQVAINEEKAEWAKAGMSTDMITHDIFVMDAQMTSLVNFLVEKGVIDKEEMDEFYRKALLDKLRVIRKNLEPVIKAQRAREQLLGPNGMPLA